MNNSFFHNFIKHRVAAVCAVILILELLCILILPLATSLDPYTCDVLSMNKAPSKAHLLGTDTLGRDILARLVYGGRNSLFIGIVSTLISVVIGLPLGLYAGYYKGFFSSLIMRLADMFMSFPSTVLILVVVALFGSTVTSMTVIIGILGWPAVARLLSANVLSEREKEYVLAARTIGTREQKILWTYILPNSVSPLWMSLAFRISQAMIMESGLSFLGAGVMPPESSWGNIIQDANSLIVLSTRWWIWVPAGICLIFTIVCINFVGEGIRDALDPKLKRI